jgi:Na+/citrate or Na+/malate symporter
MKMLLGLLMTFCDTKFPIIPSIQGALDSVYVHLSKHYISLCHIVSQNKIKTMEKLAKLRERTFQT